MSDITKRCPHCDRRLPLEEFGMNRKSSDGRHGWCKDCTNTQKRPATPERMARNRANHRARALLASRHEEEFRRLVADEYAKALQEIESLAKPGADHVTRLRPGARRDGQDAAARIDVAWCEDCHEYHDSGHQCPRCVEREARIAAAKAAAAATAAGIAAERNAREARIRALNNQIMSDRRARAAAGGRR